MDRAELRNLVLATGSAHQAGEFVFMCDPRWGAAERAQLARLQESARHGQTASALGWLCVPTGGTSGGLRFARHDEYTFAAAVSGFCEFFELQRVNAVDVLPAFHVSGLMARVRCAETGGRHVAWSWKELEAGKRPELTSDANGWLISLVPTQLQRLLAQRDSAEWLRRFRIVLIGGGPTWPELERAANAAELRTALTYGMTETAAMVAAVPPDRQRGGGSPAANPLPHARFSLSETGTICIGSESVFRGYFPQLRTSRIFETEDFGEIEAAGAVKIFGRRDAAIITGGKKVQPQEVEAALRATAQFEDVAVIGVASAEWGEMVVACYPASATAPDLSMVEQALSTSIAAFKRPKRYVALLDWPRNAQGKLNRSRLTEAASAGLSGAAAHGK